MQALTVFNFGDANVRTVTLDDEPYFVAKDVAEILGYSDTAKAVKTHCKRYRPVGVGVSPTLFPSTNVIPEGDVYRLVMKSKLPGAEAFEEWVVEEVLPAIRKTGSYSVARDPISDIDRLVPAIASGMSNIRLAIEAQADRLAVVEERQKEIDPQAIAIEAADIETARRKRLGEMRGDLAKLVELIVASAKKLPPEDVMAQDWNHFSKTWKPIHRHVGVNRIADYVTVEQFERAILFARHILVRLGVEPPTQLRLVG